MRTTTMRNAAIAALVLAAGAISFWLLQPFSRSTLQSDPDNPAQVALGREVYSMNCASCHGANLEGEPNWQTRKPTGRLPAPPHDASGHTWHHPDAQLFGIVKSGLTPYAPPGYQSDMPAYAGSLSDEQISAVLAYIKSSWPADIRARQAEMSRRAP
jgi:mono/diheme cytochrome c family protein